MSVETNKQEDLAKTFPNEARYKLLLKIHRASHFEWIRTVKRLDPTCDVSRLVLTYWDEVAKDTAESYLKILNRDAPLASQIASLIVKSSVAMGEDASLILEGQKAIVHHSACPWWDWHQKAGLAHLDKIGCDTWFTKVVLYINSALDGKVSVTTECALPDGESCCRRVFWE
jgi:hypothetical protein